eukprot:9851817-Ditylum_brightwellii.AAC.4
MPSNNIEDATASETPVNHIAYYIPSNTMLMFASSVSGTPVNEPASTKPSNISIHITASETPVNYTANSMPSTTMLLSASAVSKITCHLP